MKYAELKHGFYSKTFTRFSEKKPTSQELWNFFLQNVPNEIFKIFKLFENNMKLNRAACKINSKISNRDKNTIRKIFLFYYYCWLLFGVIIESF